MHVGLFVDYESPLSVNVFSCHLTYPANQEKCYPEEIYTRQTDPANIKQI